MLFIDFTKFFQRYEKIENCIIGSNPVDLIRYGRGTVYLEADFYMDGLSIQLKVVQKCYVSS